MSQDSPPVRAPTRTCPRCGVAMVGRKADARSAGDDTFECALCSTVVTFPFEEQPSRIRKRAS